MQPQFFETPEDLRRWFAEHHEHEKELIVGYYKRDSGRQSITWPESVDQALCFGWIDGVRRSIDDISYNIRFTPRKKDSTWSAVNIKRIGELIEQGLVQPAGLKAFELRKEDNSRIYSHENAERSLDEDLERVFRENEIAWSWFQAQPPSYRKTANWWVMSAKREQTRQKRLQMLIEYSARERRMTDYWRSGTGAGQEDSAGQG